MTSIATGVRAKNIDLVAPQMQDRSEILELLTKIYGAYPDRETAQFLNQSADAQALLDFSIERKLGVLAKSDDQIVGLAGWRLSRGSPLSGNAVCAELMVLYVEPHYRYQGIAERLCRHFLTVCEAKNFADPSFRLPPGSATDSLFRKLGFFERHRVYGLPPGAARPPSAGAVGSAW